MPVKMFVFELLIAANTSFNPYLGSLLWRNIEHVFVLTLAKSMFLVLLLITALYEMTIVSSHEYLFIECSQQQF